MPSESSSRGCGTECASEEPIVCTLTGRDQAARAAEFREAFAHLLATEPIRRRLSMAVSSHAGLEPSLSSLARREHECCRFFQFRVDTEGDVIVWEARTDARARSILDELMRLPETLKGSAEVTSMKQAMNAAGLAFASDTEEKCR